MLAAGDTFRAAAIDQLKIWAARAGAYFVDANRAATRRASPSTPSNGRAPRNADVLLMDTAGRLQNRAELMGELEKIVRVMKKVDCQRRRMRCCWRSTRRSDRTR